MVGRIRLSNARIPLVHRLEILPEQESLVVCGLLVRPLKNLSSCQVGFEKNFRIFEMDVSIGTNRLIEKKPDIKS